MSKVRKMRLPSATVFVDSTTATALVALGWMSPDDIGKLAFDIEMRGRVGLIEVALGYQTADVENAPDVAVAVTGYVASNGVTFHSAFTDAASTMQGKQLVRIVWLVKLTSGSTLGLARVSGSMYVIEP